jgi:hypothetical protein
MCRSTSTSGLEPAGTGTITPHSGQGGARLSCARVRSVLPSQQAHSARVLVATTMRNQTSEKPLCVHRGTHAPHSDGAPGCKRREVLVGFVSELSTKKHLGERTSRRGGKRCICMARSLPRCETQAACDLLSPQRSRVARNRLSRQTGLPTEHAAVLDMAVLPDAVHNLCLLWILVHERHVTGIIESRGRNKRLAEKKNSKLCDPAPSLQCQLASRSIRC